MKISLLPLFFLLSIFVHGQHENSLGVFESDTTWIEEIIKFPIHFAPEIKYEGYEDLRFSKHWRDSSHEEFWSYMFAWHVNGQVNQNTKTLEKNIKLYYDGIMNVVNKKKDFKVPETTVLFIKNEHSNDLDFTGKIYVYDAFNSENMITLNVKTKVYYCDIKNLTTTVFKLSIQNFDHNIWKKFNNIKIKSSICN